MGRENEEMVVGRFGEGRGLAKKREDLVSLTLDSEQKNNLSFFFKLIKYPEFRMAKNVLKFLECSRMS